MLVLSWLLWITCSGRQPAGWPLEGCLYTTVADSLHASGEKSSGGTTNRGITCGQTRVETKHTHGKKNNKKKKQGRLCLFWGFSCNASRLFISVTRTVIGADWVTSHWGEMELKICPDGQNKGFGPSSGKQRGKKRGREKKKKLWWWQGKWRGVLGWVGWGEKNQ